MFNFRVNYRPYQFLSCQNLTFPFSASSNLSHFVYSHPNLLPIPAVARSKAWVFCLSLAGIAGSNAAGGMDVCCDYSDYSLSSGRGLCDGPILLLGYFYNVFVCVCVRDLINLSKPSGALSHAKKIIIICNLAKRKPFHQNPQAISLLKEG